MIQDCTYL